MYAMFDGSIVDITMSAEREDGISNHLSAGCILCYTVYTITHTQGPIISLEFPAF